MIKIKKYGFKIKLDKIKEIGIISDLPSFPQETNNSKELFEKLEDINFSYRNVIFPFKVTILNRIKDIELDNVEEFSIRDLYEIIKKDSHRFVNTDTFFKVGFGIRNNRYIELSIHYYTIDKEGETEIQSFENLLEYISVDFDVKKIKKKIINPRKSKYGKPPIDIEHIPLLPLLWLEYDENNELIYFNHFKLIEDNRSVYL